ncbi:MAG TPA: NADH-quinone oxidoreductase subunit L [Egibacteraceae bacterium]|nr:NADH-quinone oxidoreductase subunit L [Egibacteraceae bacterium]
MEHVGQVAAGTPPALAWLLPIVPAVSAGLLLIFGRRLGQRAAIAAIAAMAFSAVLGTIIFVWLLAQPEGGRVLVHEVATWLPVGDLQVSWAVLVDPLSTVMVLLVTWVGLGIHVYSVGYMHGDERYPQFFAYLNLFAASMLILVLGESFLVLFVGWELVGLCSYLLIGFWFENRSYASAAKKAFVVNRVGDVGFMIAMFVIFGAFGTLSFPDVLAEPGAVIGGSLAVAVGLLLFAGATGKSAQIPLFVWLPDAMAGPTPVSALIHAATMVTAGVYLLARTSPIFALIPHIGLFVAWVGAATALLAALIACAQVDLKRILAYSTVSQLGYMFIGVGVGAQVAGVFHLLTHGFFKALLFLAAGSVMHALANETDVWRMGGLRKAMPITFATSLVGWLAISGIPPLSGFFSKEEVLIAALDTPGAQGIWLIGTVVAGITAFYMSRWFFLIFLGEPRAADLHPHESPPTMTIPLVLLAVGAAFAGLLNVSPAAFLRFWNPEHGFLHAWLEPSVALFSGEAPLVAHGAAMLAVLGAGALGIAVAWALYLRGDLAVRRDRAAARAAAAGPYRLAYEKFYVDELYQGAIERPGRMLAEAFAFFDRAGIDGAVNGIARATGGMGSLGRRLQTGFVRTYALAILAGAAIVVAILLLGTVA